MSEFALMANGAEGMIRERARLEREAREVATAQASGHEFDDTLTHMVAMLNVQRAYEADVSIFDVGKRVAERTIDLGRL